MSAPQRSRRTVGLATAEAAAAGVALLFSLLVAVHTVASARVAPHEWHQGVLALGAVPAIAALLASLALVLGLRALRRGLSGGAPTRGLPLLALALSLAALLVAAWMRDAA